MSARLKVGVLGGMGPDATVDFMSSVIRLTPADGDRDHVPMIVEQNPHVPDRQGATPEQAAAINNELAEMALRLQTAGADFLVMPCNTAHGFIDSLLERIEVPFVHIVDETVAAIRRIDDEANNIGLMATDACLESKLYQDALHSAGMHVLLPSTSEQQTLMELVFRIKAGEQSQALATEMHNRANSLVQQGADVIVGGCTEIPLVVDALQLSVPFLSSTAILAEQTVKYSLGELALPGQP